MHTEQDLINALQAIECKQAGLPAAEPSQAEQAKALILTRCGEMASAADVAEYRFTVNDPWSQFLFHALLKRYGLKGYRYKGQRTSTIMVRASKRLLDEVLEPLFVEMSRKFNEYLAETARKVFSEALSPAPYRLEILPAHNHAPGQLCPECARRLEEK